MCGLLQRTRDRGVCDWHHYGYRAVVQIRKRDSASSYLHRNCHSIIQLLFSSLVLQVPWLHMLYAAIGAIAFTLVRLTGIHKHIELLDRLWFCMGRLFTLILKPLLCVCVFLNISFWPITPNCSSGTGSSPSAQRSMCLPPSPFMSTLSRSSSSSCKLSDLQRDRSF